MKSLNLLCLAATLLIPVSAKPTQEGNLPGSNSSNQPPAKRKPFVRDKLQFVVETLKSPPDLPNLPAFPASPKHGEFLSAQLAPNTLNGQMYTISYQSKDPGETILNWYEQAFKTYGWTQQRIGMMINADKDGARCQVFLLRAIRKEFKTNFVIMYTLPPAKK